MTIIITILIALLAVLLDYKAYCRIKNSGVNKFVKKIFLFLVTLSYLLILLTPVLMYFVIDEENSSFMMKTSMILLTTYLTLSVPRLLFYFMWLPSKNRYLFWIGLTLSSLLFFTFIYSAFITRTNYLINKVKIEFDNLPHRFDGYKLAFISDIHTGSMIDADNELKEIFQIISSSGVDIVLFGGDIINIHHSEITDLLLSEYSSLKASDGVFMVLGNHDTGAYIKSSNKAKREANTNTLVAKMESAGWCVLRDSTVYIYRDVDSIAITGIDYSENLLEYKHSMDAVKGVDLNSIYNNVPDSVFNITLSHLPQLWHSLCDGGYSDLTLSGHIHAMQFKIGSFSPAKFMYDEWSGLYESEKGKLYINDGIGCVGYFSRIGACPEITIIELSTIK